MWTAPFHWLSHELIKKGPLNSDEDALPHNHSWPGCSVDAFLLLHSWPGTLWKPSSSSWLECNVTSCFKLLQPWLLCHDKALPPRLLLVTVFSHRNEMDLRQVLRSRMGQAESLEKPGEERAWKDQHCLLPSPSEPMNKALLPELQWTPTSVLMIRLP